MHAYQCDVLSLSTVRDKAPALHDTTRSASFSGITEPMHEKLFEKVGRWIRSHFSDEKLPKVETNGEGSQPAIAGSTSIPPLESPAQPAIAGSTSIPPLESPAQPAIAGSTSIPPLESPAQPAIAGSTSIPPLESPAQPVIAGSTSISSLEPLVSCSVSPIFSRSTHSSDLVSSPFPHRLVLHPVKTGQGDSIEEIEDVGSSLSSIASKKTNITSGYDSLERTVCCSTDFPRRANSVSMNADSAKVKLRRRSTIIQ